MKQVFGFIAVLACAGCVALTAVSCDNEKKSIWDVPSTDTGEYAFTQSEIVVDVAPDTESFRVELIYTRTPENAIPLDKKDFVIYINPEKSSDNIENYYHFDYVYEFTRAEDGSYYADIEIYADKITEELTLCLVAPDPNDPTYDNYYSRSETPNKELIVKLRPVAAK